MIGPIPYGFCHCGCGEKTRIAERDHRLKGWIKGEPLRYLPRHNRRGSPVDYLVNQDTGCWEWQLYRDPRTGYGKVARCKQAHRVIYERLKGPIPDGLQLDHLCRNRGCVNPDHLEPVTCRENLRRGLRGNATLTRDQVPEVRSLCAAGWSQSWIAAAYGITQPQVSQIHLRKSWADVP